MRESKGTPIAEVWREVCNNYLFSFALKHEYDTSDIDNGYAWVGGDPGTVANLGDMWINMDDIRYDIDNKIPADRFEAWYWKALDRAEANLKYMNYRSFCMGAPDPLSPEKEAELKQLRSRVKEAQAALDDAIRDYVVDRSPF